MQNGELLFPMIRAKTLELLNGYVSIDRIISMHYSFNLEASLVIKIRKGKTICIRKCL